MFNSTQNEIDRVNKLAEQARQQVQRSDNFQRNQTSDAVEYSTGGFDLGEFIARTIKNMIGLSK